MEVCVQDERRRVATISDDVEPVIVNPSRRIEQVLLFVIDG